MIFRKNFYIYILLGFFIIYNHKTIGLYLFSEFFAALKFIIFFNPNNFIISECYASKQIKIF